MTDKERDALLLRLEGKVDGLGIYVRAIAKRLLAPAEICEIEAQVTDTESVAAD